MLLLNPVLSLLTAGRRRSDCLACHPSPVDLHSLSSFFLCSPSISTDSSLTFKSTNKLQTHTCMRLSHANIDFSLSLPALEIYFIPSRVHSTGARVSFKGRLFIPSSNCLTSCRLHASPVYESREKRRKAIQSEDKRERFN